MILDNQEYMLDLCIRMAHHSTAIEGNTLTQDETASIILDNYIPRAIKDREFYEVRNYKYLLPYFIEKLKSNTKIDLELIKFFHSFIMKDLHEEAGKFKTLENAIIGADFETAKPYLVSSLLKDMCDNLYYKLENSKNDEEKIKAILQSHIHFEKIHPFSDGNGRTGRLLIIYSCFENNLTPIILPKEEKAYYISCLRANKIDDVMIDFIKKIQKEEQQRIEKFKSVALNLKNDLKPKNRK